jgi:hypothetical protein
MKETPDAKSSRELMDFANEINRHPAGNEISEFLSLLGKEFPHRGYGCHDIALMWFVSPRSGDLRAWLQLHVWHGKDNPTIRISDLEEPAEQVLADIQKDLFPQEAGEQTGRRYTSLIETSLANFFSEVIRDSASDRPVGKKIFEFLTLLEKAVPHGAFGQHRLTLTWLDPPPSGGLRSWLRLNVCHGSAMQGLIVGAFDDKGCSRGFTDLEKPVEGWVADIKRDVIPEEAIELMRQRYRIADRKV